MLWALLAGFVPAARAEEAAETVLPGDRARLVQMLKEMQLPPAVSYNQAPPPLARAPFPMRQHEVEEIPRES